MKKKEKERKRDERTVLSLANAFPSTSSLLREEHEKSNVSIFRFSRTSLQPSRANSSIFPLVLRSFFLLRFSRNIPTKRTVRRRRSSWQVPTTGTCERRAPTGTGYLEGINPISSRALTPTSIFHLSFPIPLSLFLSTIYSLFSFLALALTYHTSRWTRSIREGTRKKGISQCGRLVQSPRGFREFPESMLHEIWRAELLTIHSTTSNWKCQLPSLSERYQKRI